MYSCYLKDTLRWMVDHTCQGMVLCSLCSRAWCSHKADQWQTQSSSNETNGCREIGGRKDQTKKFKLLQLLLHPQSLRGQIFFRWWLFQIFLFFIPIWKRFPILTQYFSDGLVQPPSSFSEAGTPPDPSKVASQGWFLAPHGNVNPPYKAWFFGIMNLWSTIVCLG